MNGFRIGDVHRVQRVGNSLQVPARKVQVDDRVFELDMAEQELNGAQIGACFQEMSCVGMPTIPGPE